jgi:hypothetical protein
MNLSTEVFASKYGCLLTVYQISDMFTNCVDAQRHVLARCKLYYMHTLRFRKD